MATRKGMFFKDDKKTLNQALRQTKASALKSRAEKRKREERASKKDLRLNSPGLQRSLEGTGWGLLDMRKEKHEESTR